MRKAVYLVVCGLTFYLAGAFRLPALMLLFFAELFFFVALFALSLYFSRKIALTIRMESVGVHAGEFAVGQLVVTNRGMLPLTRFDVQLCSKQQEFPMLKRRRFSGSVLAHAQSSLDFRVLSNHCGVLCLSAEQFVVCDYFMLFKRRKKLADTASVFIFPSVPPMRLESHGEGFARLRSQELQKPGAQPPEILQLKEYQPGDPVRDIHWKLSAKSDTLLSKRYLSDEAGEIAVFLDLRLEPKDPPAALEAVRELAASLSLGLLDQQQPHRFWWYSKQMGGVVVKEVQDEGSYRDMMMELLSTPRLNSSEVSEEAYFSEVYHSSLTGSVFLRLDARLRLVSGKELLASFSRENYRDELERRCVSV